MISIIVAYDEDRAIGKNGEIPWRIPADMKHFQETTINHMVIMGRKTWDSLPSQPLPKRLNVVLSRNLSDKFGSSHFYSTVEDVISLKEWIGSEIFVIGGAEIYKAFLDRKVVDRIIASEVKGRHEGDTFFPALDTDWTPAVVKEYTNFNIVEYRRSAHVST